MIARLSASIMCADPLHMQEDLAYLQREGIDFFHCDIMDGHFVPNLMLSTETLKAVRKTFRTPLDYHFMTEQPERMLDWFPIQNGDVVSIHYESTPHVRRALDMVRERGATPALALNPATPVECARDVLDAIGMLLVMTVNPGFAAQKMTPSSLSKIERARTFLDANGYADMAIEVDGNCNYERIPQMQRAGADTFVVGSSSVFSSSLGIEEGLRRTRMCLSAAI